MNEYSTPVNDGQTGDESLSQQVDNAESVNAENAEVTNGGQETALEGSQQTTDAQPEAKQKTSQSKEENAQFAKVRKEAEASVRAEIEQKQAIRDTEFAKRAAQFGWVDGNGNPIKTEDAYWQAVDAQAQIDSLVNQGKDPEAARLQVEYDRLKNEREAERTAAQEQARKQAENAEFFAFYEEVNGKEFSPTDEIPAEVFQISQEKGIPLKYAYAEHIAKVAREKEKNIALGKQTAEVNAQNATTSTGSVIGTSGAEPEFYTKDQVAAMTSADVHKHFDKIEASMNRWA